MTILNTVNEKMRTALVIFDGFCFIFPTHSKIRRQFLPNYLVIAGLRMRDYLWMISSMM